MWNFVWTEAVNIDYFVLAFFYDFCIKILFLQLLLLIVVESLTRNESKLIF